MSHQMSVVRTTNLEVHIAEELLTPEALRYFSSFMFEVNSKGDLYRYAAEMISQRPYPHLIEGLGQAEFMNSGPVGLVSFRILDVDSEVYSTGGIVSPTTKRCGE